MFMLLFVFAGVEVIISSIGVVGGLQTQEPLLRSHDSVPTNFEYAPIPFSAIMDRRL